MTSEGDEAQESRRSGDGSNPSCALEDPEARAGRNVKPPEGERGGAANKAGAKAHGCMLWRDETQEGNSGRDPRVPVQQGLVAGTRP